MKKLLLLTVAILLSNFSFATNHTVSTIGMTFNPNALTINIGDSVTFINTGGFHNVNGTTATFPNNPAGFSNPTGVSSGWTYLHVFTTPGTYNYQCDPHIPGMVGTIIVQPSSSPTITSIIPTNPLCYLDINGSATVSINQSNPPIDLNVQLLRQNSIGFWIQIASSNSNVPAFLLSHNFVALGAGAYRVDLKDAVTGVLFDDAFFNLLEPAKLRYGIYNWIHETCTGDGLDANSSGSCDGQIMVNISGGTGNYYWDRDTLNVWPILAQHQELIINDTLIKDLCNAEWKIFITDDNGCDGEVILGGTGTKMINSLVNTSLAVTNIPYGFANVSTDSTTCSNSNDGQAKIPNVPGANPLLNYSWILDPYLAPNSVIGLQSFAVLNTIVDVGASTSILDTGDYVLVAHYADAASFGINYLGCDAKKEFEILGPLAIQANVIVNDVSCFEDCDGTITLNVNGGVPASSGATYTYLWNDVLGQTYNPAIGLCAGSYTCTVTDMAGCSVISNSILVSEPNEFIANIILDNAILCNGGTGDLSITTTGGTGPISSYAWSNGINGLTTTGLSGNYACFVIDGNGCSETSNYYLSEPSIISSWSAIIACDSYTWEGQTITSSQVLTHTYIGGSVAGCDSTHTLSVTINPIIGSSSAIACDSYTWEGQTITSSQVLTHTYIGGSAVGCDSTHTLSVTINSAITSTILGNTQTVSLIQETYVVSQSIGSVYNWQLSGGNIVSGQNTNVIDVIWGNTSGTYTLYVIETDINGCIGDTVYLSVTVGAISNIENQISSTDKKLLRITDMLGQETPYRRNTPLFYIYDDGTVEKRIIIE
jgi:plastocyanin